jgi:hypothetical protein
MSNAKRTDKQDDKRKKANKTTNNKSAPLPIAFPRESQTKEETSHFCYP